MAMRLDQVKRTVRLTALSDEMPFDVGSLARAAQKKGGLLDGQPGTKTLSTGDNANFNRGQEKDLSPVNSDQPGTTPTSTGDNEPLNRGQQAFLSPVRDETSSPAAIDTVALPEITNPTGDKSTLVPGSTTKRPRLKESLSPVEVRSNRGQNSSVPGSTTKRPRLNSLMSPVTETANRGQKPIQPGTAQQLTGDNLVSNRGLTLPTSQQQLHILAHLIASQESTGLGHTPRLSRSELSTALKISSDGLKRQLQRMIDAAFIVRLEAKDGRHEGGTVYQIPRETSRAFATFNRGQENIQPGTASFATGDKPGYNRGQQPGTSSTLVSSSDLNTTTTDKDRAERFQNASERFGLHDIGLGANDLLQVWRKGVFQDEADFIASLEHLAFYLGTADAKSLTHPKAWVTSQLAKGFYPPPAGFKSWDERQLEAKLAAHREKLARLEALQKEEQEIAFSVWLAEKTDDDRRRLIAGLVPDIRGVAAEAVLREKFLAAIVGS